MENIVVLGSTGSIGRNTLDVISKIGGYRLIGLSFHKNSELALQQIEKFKPEFVCCSETVDIEPLKRVSPGTRFLKGREGLIELSSLKSADIFVNALVGTSGLMPTYTILNNSKKLALANKESLVIAGKLFNALSREKKAEIIPLDSEHSAIYQCLENRDIEDVYSLILTASGGPFLGREDFSGITVEDALKHPNWSMGTKITIDSATMMNKGFEIIEARWLFNIEARKISVLIHRESIVHSAVEFIDGSIMAQLAIHDMRIPIAYALTKPKRAALGMRLSLEEIGKLHFEKPDLDRFPTIRFAYEALEKENRNLGLVLTAADEVAVDAFLRRKIAFKDIFTILERSIRLFENELKEDIFEIEKETEYIKEQVGLLIEKEFSGGV